MNAAREKHHEANRQSVRDKLESLHSTVEQKEQEMVKNAKMNDQIDMLKENIADKADLLHDRASNVLHGARNTIRRAKRLLYPGVLEEESKEAIAAAAMKKAEAKWGARKSLDLILTRPNVTASVAVLANIAEMATEKQQEIARKDEEETKAVAKQGLMAEKKLIEAVDRNKKRIEDDMATNVKELMKVDDKILESKTQAETAEKEAEKAKEKLELMKRKHARLAAMATTVSGIQQPGDQEAVKLAGNATQAEKEIQLAKLAEQKAKDNAKRAKRIEAEAKSLKSKVGKQMEKDKDHLESLRIVADQYRAVTADMNKQEPLEKERAQLAKDEKIVTETQEEAKMVKRQATEHMKNELARETTKDLLQQKQIGELKKELKADEEVIKSQKLTIKEEGTKGVDTKLKVEKAKIEASGAKMLMKEAQKEEKSVVSREKQAAMSLIAEMKVEIQRQLAASEAKDKATTRSAKQMMAQATAMMLRAKSLEGKAIKPKSEGDEKEISDSRGKLMALTFDDLKKKARELIAGGR